MLCLGIACDLFPSGYLTRTLWIFHISTCPTHVLLVISYVLGTYIFRSTSGTLTVMDWQAHNDQTNLWFSSLAYNASNCVCMSCQCMDICLGPHVPDTACYISTSCYQNINVWMQCQTIHSTEMSVIVPNHLKWNTVPLFCKSCSYKWSHLLWNKCCLGYKQILQGFHDPICPWPC